jgi:archaellum component FlaG (FlaF/FlaG flagellin family)
MRNLWVPLVAVVALGTSSTALAQRPPAISGVTGTVATKETVKDEYKVANKIVVAAEDGIEHVFPAGKGPLSDLTPGTSVAIYYESTVTEGVVTDVTGGKTEITVRYNSAKTETLVLIDTQALEPRQALKNELQGDTRVVVYRANNGSGRIARYFKPKG